MQSSTQSYMAWINWTLAVAFVVLVFGFQTGYAITNGRIAQSLGLNLTQIALVGSIYTFCFAFAQLVSGALLDRLGSQKVLPFACLSLVIGIFCVAFSNSFSMLLLSQILVALGASFGFVGAGFVGKIWFSEEKYGIMFAWVQFVASSSAFITQLFLIHLLERLPWTTVINSIAIIGTIIVILMLLFLRDPKTQVDTNHLTQSTQSIINDATEEQSLIINFALFLKNIASNIIHTVTRPHIWRIMIIGSVSFGVMLSLGILWGPTLLMEHGLSQVDASRATSFSWLGLAIGAPIFAFFGQRYQHEKLGLGIGLSLQLILSILFVSTQFNSVLLGNLIMFIWGFAAGASMLPFAIIATMAGSKNAGTSASLINGSQFLMGGFLLTIPGFLMENHLVQNVQHSLWCLPIIIIIVLILLPKLRVA